MWVKIKKIEKRGANGGENGRRSELWFITILNKSWSSSGRTQEGCRGGEREGDIKEQLVVSVCSGPLTFVR